MSYKPTTWHDGDIVTSQKLNKLEEGIANKFIILHASADQDGHAVLDMTFNDMYAKAQQGNGFLIWQAVNDNKAWIYSLVSRLTYNETTHIYTLEATWLDPNISPDVYTGNSLDDFPQMG